MVDEGQPPEGFCRNWLGQAEERTDFYTKIGFVGAGMIGLVREKVGAGEELITADGRIVGNGAGLRFVLEGAGLVEGEIVGADAARGPALGGCDTILPMPHGGGRPRC